MPTGYSFREYVKQRFYNDLYEAAENYVLADYDELYLPTKHVVNIGRVELQDASIERVFVSDLPGSRVSIDVVMSLDLTLFEKTYGANLEDECSAWVRVTCEGDLDKNLDDFEVNEIEPYVRFGRSSTDLSDTLVPYLKREQFDDVATAFLRQYYPEALGTTPEGMPPVKVDPIVLASRLNLNVIERYIREDASVFGQIYFADADASFYDDNARRLKTERVNANTIVVDPRNFLLRNLGSKNYTIVHECVHYVKHSKAFKFGKIYAPDASNISCEVVGGVESSLADSMAEIMEWQANQLAPRILMPLLPFKAKAREYITLFMRLLEAKHECDVMELVISELAEKFCVSEQAAKIRLIELGFDNAIGTKTYLDGHWVKPHGFRNGFLKPNQTFSVSAQDAAVERFRNPDLKEKTKDGTYLFLDNHYVYNSPLYVGKNELGKLDLTDYARSHMDECCLVFDLKVTSNIGKGYHTVCFLNRGEISYTFDIAFHGEYEGTTPEKQKALLQAEMNEWIKIRKQMTDDPVQCFNLLLEWRNVDPKELAKVCGISTKSIGRYVEGEKTPRLETAVRICFGLELPPMISEKLLDVWGHKLNPWDPDHMWIKEALTLKFPEGCDEAMDWLKNLGVTWL